jgi:DNA-binding GntR family transcriptional regulator
MAVHCPLGEFVRPPTLAEAAAAKLGDSILSGDLTPGFPLREVELSESLNISRGTFREALRLLQEEGLVDIVPHRGASVTRLTPDKVQEICSLRAVLESYAVRLALQNKAYSESDVDQMETLVTRLGELEREGNIPETIRTDMELHRLICERSEHQLLLQVLDRLRSLHTLFILNTKLYDSDMTSDEASHRSVLDAILSGDPEQGEAVVREHIQQAGAWLLDRMKQADWEKFNAT